MFLGEYRTKFTGFGRVILPKKIREEILGTKFVLSRGFEGCVWGFTIEGWENETKRQLEVSATDETARKLRRYLFSGSETVELDGQGRFVIPRGLVIYGKLGKEVVIIGAGDHFEVWNTLAWEEHLREIEKEYAR